MEKCYFDHRKLNDVNMSYCYIDHWELKDGCLKEGYVDQGNGRMVVSHDNGIVLLASLTFYSILT